MWTSQSRLSTERVEGRPTPTLPEPHSKLAARGWGVEIGVLNPYRFWHSSKGIGFGTRYARTQTGRSAPGRGWEGRGWEGRGWGVGQGASRRVWESYGSTDRVGCPYGCLAYCKGFPAGRPLCRDKGCFLRGGVSNGLLVSSERVKGVLVMNKVVLLVGVSGSGKSTFAAREYPGAVTVSADHHFMVDGEYRFEGAKLGEAHGACLRAFVGAVQGGEGCVVVDNTNTSLVELAPYVSVAKAYGYGVEVVRVRCDVSVAAARNTHGVGEGAVRAMGERIEAMMAAGLPPFWGVVVREVGA